MARRRWRNIRALTAGLVTATVATAAVTLVGVVPVSAEGEPPPPPPALCPSGSLPISGLKTTDKVITFTFDDGPAPRSTEPIMKAFEARGLTATFFLVTSVAKYRPDYVRSMAARGFEIANHSVTHHFDALHNLVEVSKAQDALAAITGVRPLFYRHPYLNWSKRVIVEVGKQGLCALGTNVSADDWLMPRRNALTLCRTFMRRLRPGALVLLHDGGGAHQSTVAAVPCMLDYALGQGYQILGLRDFLARAVGDPANFTYNAVRKR